MSDKVVKPAWSWMSALPWIILACLFGARWLALPRWIDFVLAGAGISLWAAKSAMEIRPQETETQRRQRMRNIAIGASLAALVALFYLATMARLGGNALNRPI